MRRQLGLFRLFALIGLAASTASAVNSLWAVDALCPFEGSCAPVTSSSYSSIFGVPVYVIGLAGFTVFFALTFVPNQRVSLALRAGGIAAGAVGVVMLAIQIGIIGQVCRLCLVADLAGIGLAVAALLRRPKGQFSRWQFGGWLIAAFAAVALPAMIGLALASQPVPDRVRLEWVPGEITIVEVTDFDCDHCQRADAVLRDALSRHNVRIVRIVAPMPRNEDAGPAARAYLAAKRQGKDERMAARLYSAESRSQKACRQMAVDLGLNMADFERALDDPAIAKEIRDNVAWARAVGTGLPMIWVQDQVLPPSPSASDVESAIARVQSSQH
jgi:uncharacterized membrane protein/predicted DsbA family dithiol-disulfide isomerase